MGGGKLWLCSSTAFPGSFELQSGAWKPSSGGEGSIHHGCKIAVLDGKWVVLGGRRLGETQETLSRPLGGSGFAAYPVEAQKLDESMLIPLADGSGTVLPAWDAELSVVPPKGHTGSLTAVPTEKLVGWLSDSLSAKGGGQGPAAPANAPKAKPADWSAARLWATEGPMPIACALAKDQFVVAHGGGGGAGGCKLSGFRRADGSKAWTVDLPEQPAMNRLALDRDGRVLIALCDGSVLCLGR